MKHHDVDNYLGIEESLARIKEKDPDGDITILDWYSFELPERWRELVGVKKRGSRVDLILLWEDSPGCSGLLASLKCLKRKVSKPDEYTKLLRSLSRGNGERRFLYAVYGREGVVSEENEDLYWRLRDQLCLVFESIRPAEGG